jgi:thiol-disulfide isomerase/thioredoxin
MSRQPSHSLSRLTGLFVAFGIMTALMPGLAGAQTAEPPYVAKMRSAGATPDEIAKLEQVYVSMPAQQRAQYFDGGDAATAKAILDHLRTVWAGEGAHPLMKVGSPLPQFALKGVDGKTYTPETVKDAKLLVIMFTSNHCPASQLYEGREKQLVADYASKGVAFLAVQPDGPLASAPSEHNFTDVEDDFEGMKERARFRGFTFPYLNDGDQQSLAKALGPRVTPHIFIFDQNRTLRYEGRIDNNLRAERATTHEARDAIDALLAGKEPPATHTPVFGCSTKWNDETAGTELERSQWAALPVTLEPTTNAQLTALRKTAPGKTLIINFWATWCGPCKVEMPEIVKTYQWYRSRGVDLVTVSVDAPAAKPAALTFLQQVHVPSRNLQVDNEDLYAVQAAFDPEWQSGVPLTLVLAPDGQVIYRAQGEADILKMRRALLASLDDAGPFAGNTDYWKH